MTAGWLKPSSSPDTGREGEDEDKEVEEEDEELSLSTGEERDHSDISFQVSSWL